MTRTAVEIVNLYLYEIWNAKRADLVIQICADPIRRHDPGGLRTLTHAEQIARIAKMTAENDPHFTMVTVHGDDTFVTAVWDMVADGGDWILSGIETFKVIDGRITDVWNTPYATEPWG